MLPNFIVKILDNIFFFEKKINKKLKTNVKNYIIKSIRTKIRH